MKLNRIISVLLALFLSFTFIDMNALPVSAKKVKASELGIYVTKPSRYLNDNGKYTLKITITNDSCYVLKAGAYLYNADSKLLASWTNNSSYYILYPGEERTIKFSEDYSKHKGSSFNIQFKATTYDEYGWDGGTYDGVTFKWNWKVTKEETKKPSVSFDKLSYQTLKSGKVAPRINVKHKNVKGQTTMWYIVDEYGYLIKEHQGKRIDSNSGTAWLSWNGAADGLQYPDGYYTVVVEFSGGSSISKTFYLEFSKYGYG